MITRPFFAAMTAFSLLLASHPATARECAYFSGNGPSVYGMHQGLTGTYANAIDQAKMGGFRMGFRIDTQPAWNQALFDQYDALLAVAREHGLDVMAIVLYESTPPSAGGQAAWNSGYDASGMNAYVQAFVDTTKILMSRYGDRIKYWEIWNEPNAWTNANYASDPTHAGGTYILPLVYSKLLAETYVQNKATITSQGLHLVAGGLFAHDIGGGFSPATDYAQELFAQGVWSWMQANEGRRYPWDGFGYHIYIDQGGATSSAHLLRYVDAIQQSKIAASDYVPLWITEFGWQAPRNMTVAQQAANLDTALGAFESRGDVARTFVFKIDDYDDWGIYDASWAPKPAVATYATHAVGCTHLPIHPLDAGTDAAVDGDAGAGRDAGADAGGGVDAGADAGAIADGGAIADASGGSAGCACAHAPSRGDGPTLALGAAIAAALARRRRLRASRPSRPSRRSRCS